MNLLLSASLGLLLVLWTVPLTGAPPVQATVCTIMQKPSAFSGRVVQVKGTVEAGFEKFSVENGGCGPIWIDLADDQHVIPPPNFTLTRDRIFATFERLMKANSTAEVTLVGRLDGVDEVEAKRYVRERRRDEGGATSAVVGWTSTGFGHMGQYKARLVLKQVLKVGAASRPLAP